MFVGALDAGGEDGMILCRVGAYDEDEASALDVGDGAGIAAVADGALEAHGGGVLAVAGAVVDVVGADDGAGELLHEEAFFVGAFGRGNEGESVGAVVGSDLLEFLFDDVEGFVPFDLSESFAVAEEGFDEAVVGVDVTPGELAFDAGGDAVGGAVHGLNLEDVAVFGPDVEAAAYGAVGADRFGALSALFAHLGLDFGEREDGAVADGRLDAFDDFDHVVEGLAGSVGEVAGLAEHGFFHEGVARTDGDAVAAGDATGAVDFFPAVPEDAGMGALPIDGEGLVDLDVLAGFDAATAEDALVGVVAIEGVGHVLLVRFGSVGSVLVFYIEVFGGVMDSAVLVVVVADGAVEHVVLEDAVEGLALGDVDCFTGGLDGHAGGDGCGAGADEFAVDFNHASVAALDGAHLLEIADVRDGLLYAGFGAAIEQVEEEFAGVGGDSDAVDGELHVGGVVGGSIEERFHSTHAPFDAGQPNR